MGTNYYWHDINAPATEVHIGKSSCGWCFSLHVYPENGIHDLADWFKIFDSFGYIRDEYGQSITRNEMIDVITNRTGRSDFNRPRFPDGWYKSWDEFHSRNYSKPGPSGLLRHKTGEDDESMENICIKNGEGTWDCIIGEFS
mgnify:CR=1 FL=1